MGKLLVANWKMNPITLKEAVALARASGAKNVVIAPPFTFLAAVGKVVTRAALGVQDVFWEVKGAYTGEVSPAMLKALGVRYVIIGHSERRALGETDEMVNKKVNASLAVGLKVILCVGEPWAVRRRGFAVAKNFVKKQLAKDLKGIGNGKLPARRGLGAGGEIENLLIAYEPIWAIGTGRAATSADASAMAQFIKHTLHDSRYTIRVLYGGSVNAGNAGAFLAEPDINGALVGGASLKPQEFKKIITIAHSLLRNAADKEPA